MKTIKVLHSNIFALVDDEDYEKVIQYKWVFYQEYPVTLININSESKHIFLHHFILLDKLLEGFQIDHKDLNKFNCQKGNLRYATHAQNCMNKSKIHKYDGAKVRSTSKFKGVSWQLYSWMVRIAVNKKQYYIGKFDSQEEAAQAYNIAAKILHKEFACLNEVAEPNNDFIERITKVVYHRLNIGR